jgi:acetylornithine deacetylase
MNAVELAERLVGTPSHGDERAAGDYIEGWLEERTDAAVERDDAGNVLARRNAGSGADRSVALVGHHDVVPPDDRQTADGEYVLERREGRLYGRGSADMKGSLAAAMVAFRDADVPEETEAVFASFVGEEAGGVGCRAAIDAGFAPEYAVVGEGSTGYSADGVTDVAVAHKGRRGSTVRAEGVAAHASEPDEGENAIYRASDAIGVIRGLDAPETAVLGHDIEGSIAVTGIDGGDAWNVIPERCSFTVDERTVPGERASIERVEAIDGVSATVEQDLPPMACDDADFAATVRAAADAAQDGTPEAVIKPHATDAGWLAARAGTTCVVCGAAEPGEAHTATESVSIEVVERCREIYRRALEAI